MSSVGANFRGEIWRRTTQKPVFEMLSVLAAGSGVPERPVMDESIKPPGAEARWARTTARSIRRRTRAENASPASALTIRAAAWDWPVHCTRNGPFGTPSRRRLATQRADDAGVESHIACAEEAVEEGKRRTCEPKTLVLVPQQNPGPDDAQSERCKGHDHARLHSGSSTEPASAWWNGVQGLHLWEWCTRRRRRCGGTCGRLLVERRFGHLCGAG